MSRRRLALLAGLGLLVLGLWQTGAGVHIYAKAWLAQVLIGQAWADVQAGAAEVRPWPWADTSPVAKITAPKTGDSVIVLSGATGRTMAFGPGHLSGTAAPGDAGASVIVAHRDTHFSFLRDLQSGDRLTVERPDGRAVEFAITQTEIRHRDALTMPANASEPQLLLVTCWPFDALDTGGPMRYAVTAVEVAGD